MLNNLSVRQQYVINILYCFILYTLVHWEIVLFVSSVIRYRRNKLFGIAIVHAIDNERSVTEIRLGIIQPFSINSNGTWFWKIRLSKFRTCRLSRRVREMINIKSGNSLKNTNKCKQIYAKHELFYYRKQYKKQWSFENTYIILISVSIYNSSFGRFMTLRQWTRHNSDEKQYLYSARKYIKRLSISTIFLGF